MNDARQRLPSRRENRTRRFVWRDGGGAEHPFDVTVGFWPTALAASRPASAGEIFIAGPREGSMLLHTLEDACVMASLLLQHGVGLDDLLARLGRGSPVGAIVAVAGEIERDPEGDRREAAL